MLFKIVKVWHTIALQNDVNKKFKKNNSVFFRL